MQGNFASYIDRSILPGRLYLVIHDPEGLTSTIPAIGTGLLGILTGSFLKNYNRISEAKKCLYMFLSGLVFLGIGQLWNLDFPINKNLWTSSFVMNVGGYSLILLSAFYFIIDVKGYRKWSFFFRVIGMNSILIYLSGRFIDWDYGSNALFGWIGQLISKPWNDVMLAACYVFTKWLFLYFMYKQKIFLRV